MEQKLESPILSRSSTGSIYAGLDGSYYDRPWVCLTYIATLRKCSRHRLPDKIRIVATKVPPREKKWIKINDIIDSFTVSVVTKGSSKSKTYCLYYALSKFIRKASKMELKYMHIQAVKNV